MDTHGNLQLKNNLGFTGATRSPESRLGLLNAQCFIRRWLSPAKVHHKDPGSTPTSNTDFGPMHAAQPSSVRPKLAGWGLS